MRHIAFVIVELRESAHDAVDGCHRWPRNVPHSACCYEAGHVSLWLGAAVQRCPLGLPLSARKKTFVPQCPVSANYVRFGPESGRIDTVTVESANDPKETFGPSHKRGRRRRYGRTW